MTYTITALTNDTARLIVSVTRTTDKAIAEMVRGHIEAQGLIVVFEMEG